MEKNKGIALILSTDHIHNELLKLNSIELIPWKEHNSKRNHTDNRKLNSSDKDSIISEFKLS